MVPGTEAARPAVFMRPGIMGSNLAAGGERVWLSLNCIGGLSKLAYHPGGDGVTPDGPIHAVYGDLVRHLAASHDVVEFAFDWRCPVEQEGRRLAAEIDKALDARQASGQPVRILAHSMGGVLARTMWLERPTTWQRMMDIYAGGTVRLHDLVTANLPITEWRAAFDLCRDRKALKVVLHPV